MATILLTPLLSVMTQCGSKCFSILNQSPGLLRAVFLQNFTRPNHGPDGTIDPRFAPTAHIFYASGTVDVHDGLPKYETKGGPDGVLLPENFHQKRAAAPTL
jgi:hypothetical protein